MAPAASAELDAAPSPHEAVRAIREVMAYEDPLRRRTEGVTWVVWGLVTATFLAVQAALGDVVYWTVWLFVWLPLWLGAGVLGTEMVWRIASVSRAALAPDARRTGVALVVGALLFVVVMVAVYPISGAAYAPQTVTVLVLPWAFLAAVQWARLSEGGRRVTVALAFLIVALGAALVFGAGTLSSADGALMAGLAAGGLPFAAGAWWTLRG